MDVLLGLGGAGIDNVQDDVCMFCLGEGCLEACNEVMRQLPNEADRVGEQYVAVFGQRSPPHPGVQRGKELVLDELGGIGQCVQES